MLPSLATHETLWRTQNLCPGHMKMFLKAPSNTVAVFSQAQDTKVDTFRHNVSATLCPSLAGAYCLLALELCIVINYMDSPGTNQKEALLVWTSGTYSHSGTYVKLQMNGVFTD